ncbi:hypothetical protein Calab_0704 [Caldithrix abyssi DSM 13497]|uniref:Uncharacterized protein n=1 Tax=Caldithrix abyssi DSM 13497 TaxID=880073 RepID=H1XTB1_CALAY|nr:hypothetical protein [Caldithrix abyssi]APF20296.1 hypothetical protein Cabys_3550 [Caldithrix abyssi DSM 13497]EHO40344.1 hypothetical protein Calab_0704 [Caldithrix abyssi DSM 13497]
MEENKNTNNKYIKKDSLSGINILKPSNIKKPIDKNKQNINETKTTTSEGEKNE